MELRDGIFAVKLCELERQYGLLQTRLELCQGAGHEKIRDILQDELNDYRENALLMERRAEGSRSPAVAELSSAQRDYDRRVEEILREKLPRLPDVAVGMTPFDPAETDPDSAVKQADREMYANKAARR